MTWASSATVELSNGAATGSSVSNVAWIRAKSRTASSESPPQVEEVLVHADPFDPEQLGPDLGELLLGGAAR
jgi:hypothetical protein